MRLLFTLCAMFMFSVQAVAAAETLERLASKSQIVRYDLKFLKRKNAVSIFAGEKSYCPSVYWWSRRAPTDRIAREGYRTQVTREMSQAGFQQRTIAHCVKNSGFAMKARVLQPHPKHSGYKRYVQAGVMAFGTSNSAKITPVLAETHSFGKASWAIYDASFKKICTITRAGSGLNASCKGFGKMTGTARRADGRTTYTLSNKSQRILIMTRRAPSFVKSAFAKTAFR